MDRRRLAIRSGHTDEPEVDSRVAEYDLRRNGSGAAGVGDLELRNIDSRFWSLDQCGYRPCFGCIL